MRHLMTFLMGMVAGALLLYAALQYHVVRSDSGYHLIAKVESELAATYVDIRGFTISDWAQYPSLVAAMMNADRRDLMETAAGDALRTGLDNVLERKQ